MTTIQNYLNGLSESDWMLIGLIVMAIKVIYLEVMWLREINSVIDLQDANESLKATHDNEIQMLNEANQGFIKKNGELQKEIEELSKERYALDNKLLHAQFRCYKCGQIIKSGKETWVNGCPRHDKCVIKPRGEKK